MQCLLYDQWKKGFVFGLQLIISSFLLQTHGVLNAVSWGILMPMGAMIARYVKVFKVANPAWFYMHIACQVTAYGVGVAGWGTGLKLGSDSVGIKYTTHRNIGITLFALGTLQVQHTTTTCGLSKSVYHRLLIFKCLTTRIQEVFLTKRLILFNCLKDTEITTKRSNPKHPLRAV